MVLYRSRWWSSICAPWKRWDSFSADPTILLENLESPCQWEGFDSPSLGSDRGGAEQRVVDGLLGGFDGGEEQRRHGLIGKNLHGLPARLAMGDPQGRGCGEGNGVVAAAVG